MMRQILRRLRRDHRGATIIEFAIVAPVLMVVIMGLLELNYRLYARAVLVGAVNKAARDSTLETGATANANDTIDSAVKNAFKQVNGRVSDSNFNITRRNFVEFSGSGKMEPSTGPGGQCAVGSTYIDANNSGSWDDGGFSGQGGANDATLYTVQVNYQSLFPVNSLFGVPSTQIIQASTILRNQPYGNQATRLSGPVRNCL